MVAMQCRSGWTGLVLVFIEWSKTSDKGVYFSRGEERLELWLGLGLGLGLGDFVSLIKFLYY
jgi:hypothetical protein